MKIQNRKWVGLLCLYAGLMLSGAASAALNQPIKVEGGLVQGVTAADGIQSFKGVPYAASTAGARRWRPPAPVESWSGVRKADRFGADCPTVKPVPESRAGAPQSEDCLLLNIWTPAKKINEVNEKLPVMVWIYGSAFEGGSATDIHFDGEGLAKKGVILVNMGYRNGVLGFLAHPLLSAESEHHASGNYGLLDVVASIQWVKRNIAAFGGDPNRITIFGQSSGSETVSIMTATPLAKGSFSRAIGESGSSFASRQPKTLATLEQMGVAYAEKLGAKSLAELRAKTTEELFNAKPPRFEPVIDGWVLPTDAYGIYSAGRQSDVPMLIGVNAEEFKMSTTLTASDYQAQIRQRYGARADEFLKLFGASTDQEARVSAQISGAIIFGDFAPSVWATLQARTGKSQVFQYRFTRAPPQQTDGVGPLRTGAYHGAEILYVFNHIQVENKPWTDLDRKLESQLSSYWVNFASKGDPNGPGLPHWPSLQENKTQLMELGDEIRLIPRANVKEVEFFEDLFYRTPGGVYR